MGIGSASTRKRIAGLACLALSVVAILLWGRLKLVTGVPRSAYADPSKAVKPGIPTPGAAGKPAGMRDPR
jgi:hypothetical protein